jgi:hypothetical protein
MFEAHVILSFCCSRLLSSNFCPALAIRCFVNLQIVEFLTLILAVLCSPSLLTARIADIQSLTLEFLPFYSRESLLDSCTLPEFTFRTFPEVRYEWRC